MISVNATKQLNLPDERPTPNPRNPKVYFDITIGPQQRGGRIIFELFQDVVPLTAENFRGLCTGEYGMSRSGKPLSFKHTLFHRIVPHFICQGGDLGRRVHVDRSDGGGGGGGNKSHHAPSSSSSASAAALTMESIYGGCFADESFQGKAGKHCAAGLLSMANSGKNKNSSHFFITMGPARWLDGKHVVFGQVLEGMDVLLLMQLSGSSSGITTADVVIADCGMA